MFPVSSRRAVKINMLTYVKHLDQCQAHEKCSVDGVIQGWYKGHKRTVTALRYLENSKTT